MSEDRQRPVSSVSTLDQEEEEEGDSRSWITIFADIALLLLVFFVLLFSMSTLDQQQYEDALLSVRRSLGQDDTHEWGIRVRTDTTGVLMDEPTQFRQLKEAQQEVFSDIQYFRSQQGLEGIVGVQMDAGKIVMRLSGEVLFDPGDIELTQEGKKVLQDLRDVFIRHPEQQINIQGHTDNVPPSPEARFEDNWELSTLRALSALRYLVELGIEPTRLTSTGLADLQPLYPNTTETNRARNRRVEFILERSIGE